LKSKADGAGADNAGLGVELDMDQVMKAHELYQKHGLARATMQWGCSTYPRLDVRQQTSVHGALTHSDSYKARRRKPAGFFTAC
jgi:hypothetical protein